MSDTKIDPGTDPIPVDAGGDVKPVVVVVKGGGVSVRLAESDDSAKVIDQIGKYVATVYAGALTQSAEDLDAFVKRVVGEPDGDTRLFLVMIDGAIVATLSAGVFTHPSTGERVASDVFWFIEPAYRGRVAVRLLQAFEDWASERRADVLVLSAPDLQAQRFFEGMGFGRVDPQYQRRLRAV